MPVCPSQTSFLGRFCGPIDFPHFSMFSGLPPRLPSWSVFWHSLFTAPPSYLERDPSLIFRSLCYRISDTTSTACSFSFFFAGPASPQHQFLAQSLFGAGGLKPYPLVLRIEFIEFFFCCTFFSSLRIQFLNPFPRSLLRPPPLPYCRRVFSEGFYYPPPPHP